MLKLEQIDIQDENDVIVEILEPIVYTKVGTIEKSDEVIQRDKANAFYLIATVVAVKQPSLKDFKYPVGTHVMITKHSVAPITFPIEGYDRPTVAVLNIGTIFGVIKDDTKFELPTGNVY